MIAAVADTHTAVWYLFDNPMLSPKNGFLDQRPILRADE